jgi:F-box protein 18 (helicase)
LIESLQLTEEQQELVEASYQKGELVKVIAFAGTGKTFTLVEVAKRLERDHPDWKILYLAFNKSIQEEAGARFPSNTVSRTTHSLAYQFFGAQYRHKLVYDLKVKELSDLLNLPRKNFMLVKYAVDTLKNYLNSADRLILNAHCPGIEHKHSAYVHKVEVVELSKHLWKSMRDTENEVVGMTHDGYLKLFQLEKSELPYDVVFFDECQDANPVTTDIVVQQQHALRVLVGDPHQQIYTFRGAVNAIDKVMADRTYYLTGSFRFGDDFANVANILLTEFKNERQDLHGLSGTGVLEKVDAEQPHAVLSRTNAGLFDEAAGLFRGKKLGFLGGIQGYRFSNILDVFHLSRGMHQRVQSRYLKRFEDIEDLQDFADEMGDAELTSLLKTVDKYGKEVPNLISNIESATVGKLSTADVLLATTHKAKGFEFKRVKMKDDFTDFFEEKDKRKFPETIPRDEINLYYVAATRAKECLQLNRKFKRILSYLNKKYENYKLPF